MLNIDAAITEFDRMLKTLAGGHAPARRAPAGLPAEGELDPAERARAAALMRVNHSGEVCAQALYQGQAMASSNPDLQHLLMRAAREEEDHLAWSTDRMQELGGRASLLNPLWYAGSALLGYAAGKAGDAWSLGFLAETERQVEAHLQGHLERLDGADARTRAVIDAMRNDEAKHRKSAEALGASELPAPVKGAMKLAARLMTTVAYWV